MSFREEDNQKNCPSRGLGLAAAAIGVGVGAALYYFFGKRSENPAPSGSTSDPPLWECETEHSLNDTNSANAQVFRKRSKTLEQCSICFDIILVDQESMVLPCTHFFHTSCILPWLQEQQTCPNCRNAVD